MTILATLPGSFLMGSLSIRPLQMQGSDSETSTCVHMMLHRHKPLLLSVHVTSVLYLVQFMTELRASIGVTRSYSSYLFLCALALNNGQ